MKLQLSNTLRLIVVGAMALINALAWGQMVNPVKHVEHIEAMPRHEALKAFCAMLDEANVAGKKVYKNMVASCEEMLSEPTWDTHNEELFKLLIEHGSTASCLNDNERLRSQSLLEVVRKNAPGTIVTDIEYETLDGSHHRLSDISTAYTLIYFNDPECFSCAKVKERLDTCSTLKSLVGDGMLTVLGIYPYDNTQEWHLEPFPQYIINGWDFKQDVETKQTYDLMTMPLFYLLDTEKRVIVKNEASLNRMLKAITRLKEMENSSVDAKLDAVFQIDKSR